MGQCDVLGNSNMVRVSDNEIEAQSWRADVILRWCFWNFGVHENHLKGLVKRRLLLPPPSWNCRSLVGWRMCIFSFFFFFFYNFFDIYLTLRDRDRAWAGEGQRKGDTKSKASSRLWAVSAEPDTRLEPMNCEIMTWAIVGRLTHWATQVPLDNAFQLEFLIQKVPSN